MSDSMSDSRGSTTPGTRPGNGPACYREQAYIDKCHMYTMHPDPTVMIALRFQSAKIALSSESSSEGTLLPLSGILRAPFITEINLSRPHRHRLRAGLGSSNMYVIRDELIASETLTTLNLAYCGIDHEGMVALCEGLAKNTSLRFLDLKGNKIGPEAGKVLAKTLQSRSAPIHAVDVAFCGLGFQVAQELHNLAPELEFIDESIESVNGTLEGDAFNLPAHRNSTADLEDQRPLVDKKPAAIKRKRSALDVRKKTNSRHATIHVFGNFEKEELWNSLTHGLGWVLAMIGTVALLMLTIRDDEEGHNGITRVQPPTSAIWGVVLFCFGVNLVFAASTLYHSMFMIESIHKIFQSLDHCSIYIMIAGTYSPICMWNEDPSKWGTKSLAVFNWALAIIGIILHILMQHTPKMQNKWFKIFELALYVIMGNSLFLWMPFQGGSVFEQMQTGPKVLLAAGGILYMGGIPFFVMGAKRPMMHCIWHFFVLAAAICHFFCIYQFAEDKLYPLPAPEAGPVFDPEKAGKAILDLASTDEAKNVAKRFAENAIEAVLADDAIENVKRLANHVIDGLSPENL